MRVLRLRSLRFLGFHHRRDQRSQRPALRGVRVSERRSLSCEVRVHGTDFGCEGVVKVGDAAGLHWQTDAEGRCKGDVQQGSDADGV